MRSRAARCHTLSGSLFLLAASCSPTPFLYHTQSLICHTRRRLLSHSSIQKSTNQDASLLSAHKETDGNARDAPTTQNSALRITYFDPGPPQGKRDYSPRRRFIGKNSHPQDDVARFETSIPEWNEERDDNPIEEETIEFDDDVDMELHERDEISDLMKRKPSRASTITTQEREAFQKIFADIFAKKQARSERSSDDFAMDHGQRELLKRDRSNTMSKLDDILSRSMQSEGKTQEEIEMIVSMYPSSLRPAAARALGMAKVHDKIEDTQDDDKAVELERLREPERSRVEKLMVEAPTDVALWAVMEKEVFPLISKLGLEDPAPANEKGIRTRVTGKRSGASKKHGVKDGLVEESALPEKLPSKETEHGLPPLLFYAPLYPSYLLLGLRLFDRSFARPSPLALSILPKIKSLGLISHVLGATTQLYNELIQIYRFRHDDYVGVDGLLAEMQRSGLDFDDETLSIISSIRRAQRRVLKGEMGPTLQRLWQLPEFAPRRFAHWEKQARLFMSE